MSVTVSVNGIPVEEIVDQEIRDEIQTHRQYEVGTIKKSIGAHIISSSIRNHSGSRTSRGRVIMQGGVLCQ